MNSFQKLKELQEKYKAAKDKYEAENKSILNTFQEKINNNLISINIRVPQYLVHLKEISKTEKTFLIYFAILKSYTKSDRISTADIEKLGLSNTYNRKIIKKLVELDLIKINYNKIIFKSWKKIIEDFRQKYEKNRQKFEIKRQKIKFYNIKIDFDKEKKKNRIAQELLKEWYKFQIKRYISVQQYTIKKKAIQNLQLEKYALEKQEKLYKCLRNPVRTSREAALREYANKIEKFKNNKQYRKAQKIEVTQEELNTHLRQLQIASLHWDIFNVGNTDKYYICLNSRGVGKRLNLSHAQANNLLNEFNYDLKYYRLDDRESEAAKSKRYFKIDNWYMFGTHYYFMGRVLN